MIALASECLLFEGADGQKVPFSAEVKAFELTSQLSDPFAADLVRQASHAVLYYFKHELGRQSVSVGEFAGALEKVLKGLILTAKGSTGTETGGRTVESDLQALVSGPEGSCELIFFSRLREELRRHLMEMPRIVHFHGLRGCVLQLMGTRRWTARCRKLEEQIVAYLRECMSAEGDRAGFALVVD